MFASRKSVAIISAGGRVRRKNAFFPPPGKGHLCLSSSRARAPSTLLSSRCSVKYPTPNAIANPGAEVNLRQVRVPKLRSDESPPNVFFGVPERHGRSRVPSLPLYVNLKIPTLYFIIIGFWSTACHLSFDLPRYV